MSKNFWPLAGLSLVLAFVSYFALSLVFPHKKEEIVDTQTKPEAVFAAQIDEASASATATVSNDVNALSLATDGAVPAEAEASNSEPPADEPATSEPAAEPASQPTTEAPPEAAAETPASESAAEPVTATAPADTAAPAPAAGSTLTREQLVKIVAESAAKAAAETAKSLAEQAARNSAAH